MTEWFKAHKSFLNIFDDEVRTHCIEVIYFFFYILNHYKANSYITIKRIYSSNRNPMFSSPCPKICSTSSTFSSPRPKIHSTSSTSASPRSNIHSTSSTFADSQTLNTLELVSVYNSPGIEDNNFLCKASLYLNLMKPNNALPLIELDPSLSNFLHLNQTKELINQTTSRSNLLLAHENLSNSLSVITSPWAPIIRCRTDLTHLQKVIVSRPPEWRLTAMAMLVSMLWAFSF